MDINSNSHNTYMSEQPPLARFDTLHLNLWGTPGVGKSAIAGKLYGKLKEAGYEAMYVQDYAKELALQGKLAWRNGATGEIREYEQFLISSEQYRRQSELDGLVEVVITDSPLLQQTIFAPDNYAQSLLEMLNELTIGWTSMDVLLNRDISDDYSSLGRIRSAKESMALQPEIIEIVSVNRPDYLTMNTEGAEKRLFDLAVDHLQRKRTYRPTL